MEPTISSEGDDQRLSLLRRNYEKLVTVHSKKKVFAFLQTGAMNPTHRMHIRSLLLAKTEVEERMNAVVVCGFLSPSHDDYVRQKLGDSHLCGGDRLKILSLSIRDLEMEEWIQEDRWEIEQQHFNDSPLVFQHLSSQIRFDHRLKELKEEGRPPIQLSYVCGADHAWRCHLLQFPSIPVFCLPRSFEYLHQFLSLYDSKGKHEKEESNDPSLFSRPLLNSSLCCRKVKKKRPIEEDNHFFILLNTQMEDISSTLIRDLLSQRRPEALDSLMTPSAIEYLLSGRALSTNFSRKINCKQVIET